MDSQGIKGLPALTTWIGDRLAWVERDVFMEPDEFAFRRGWTVTSTVFGARSYRHPGFDGLARGVRHHPAKEPA